MMNFCLKRDLAGGKRGQYIDIFLRLVDYGLNFMKVKIIL